jgi:hypothetical protein
MREVCAVKAKDTTAAFTFPNRHRPVPERSRDELSGEQCSELLSAEID